MLEFMVLRSRLLYIIGTGLIGAFLLAVVGCSFSAMPMHLGAIDMNMCDGAMHLTPYIASTRDQGFGQLLSLFVGITIAVIAWSAVRLLYAALAPPLKQYLVRQLRILSLLHNYLLTSFSQGILHPKIY